MKSWRSKVLWEIWLPVLLLVIWWFASANSASFYFPPLAQILSEFKVLWIFENVPTEIVPSLARLAAGFAIAIVVGVASGLLLGSVRALEEAVRPIIEFLRATPGVAVLPIMMLLLGIGTAMKMAIIAPGQRLAGPAQHDRRRPLGRAGAARRVDELPARRGDRIRTSSCPTACRRSSPALRRRWRSAWSPW